MSDTKNQQLIIKHLKEQIALGKRFFKAKYIGQDLGLSAKVIGVNLYKISKISKQLIIEQYSEANSVTWRVLPREGKGNAV